MLERIGPPAEAPRQLTRVPRRPAAIGLGQGGLIDLHRSPRRGRDRMSVRSPSRPGRLLCRRRGGRDAPSANCATSRGSARRTRAGINERSPASTARPISRMVAVSSSMNSGTPSVLVTICSTISAGSDLPSARVMTISLHLCRVSFARSSTATLTYFHQCGSNSGR